MKISIRINFGVDVYNCRQSVDEIFSFRTVEFVPTQKTTNSIMEFSTKINFENRRRTAVSQSKINVPVVF